MKRKSLPNQLFDEFDDLVEMIDECGDYGPHSRAEASYKKFSAELLLFIFLTLRRLFFISAILIGALLSLSLRG